MLMNKRVRRGVREPAERPPEARFWESAQGTRGGEVSNYNCCSIHQKFSRRDQRVGSILERLSDRQSHPIITKRFRSAQCG